MLDYATRRQQAQAERKMAGQSRKVRRVVEIDLDSPLPWV
jgi:hypothetical protein